MNREIKFELTWEKDGTQFKQVMGIESIIEGVVTPKLGGKKAPLVRVRQFTGRNDKYHREIFEGDIVRSDFYHPEIDCVSSISYSSELMRFVFDSVEQDAFEYGNLQVIGNIHQNPELLK